MFCLKFPCFFSSISIHQWVVSHISCAQLNGVIKKEAASFPASSAMICIFHFLLPFRIFLRIMSQPLKVIAHAKTSFPYRKLSLKIFLFCIKLFDTNGIECFIKSWIIAWNDNKQQMKSLTISTYPFYKKEWLLLYYLLFIKITESDSPSFSTILPHSKLQ